MVGPFKLENIENIVKQETSITKISKIVPIDEGISSYTYKIETDNLSYYFSTLIEDYKNVPLSPRMNLLSKIANNDLKVPIPIAYRDFDENLELYSWALVSEIDGTDLERSNTKNDELLVDAGKDLARLHRIHNKGFGYVRNATGGKPIGESKTYFEHLTYRLRNPAPFETKINLLQNEGYITEKEKITVNKFIERNKKLVSLSEGVLMHGDFSKDHIFQSEGKYTGIIDWDGISVGSGLYDLVQFETLSSKSEFDALLRGYFKESELKYNNEFKQKLFFERLLYVIPKIARIIQAKTAKKAYASQEREKNLERHLNKMVNQICSEKF